MPSASDANQCCQMVKLGAVEKWNNLNPRTPPIPEIALANTAAASNPKTCRSAVEGETRTKLALDKASREHRFSGIAQRKSDSARKAPVSQKIGRDRCRGRSDGHRPFRPGTKGNQDACRNTGGWPEHCHAIRFCQ